MTNFSRLRSAGLRGTMAAGKAQLHAVSATVIAGVHVLPPMFSPAQLANLLGLKKLNTHHDDDGGHHIHQGKTLNLPWVAEAIWPHVSTVGLGNAKPHSVDPMMKIYRLSQGAGIVHPHQDEDFDGPDGTKALHSIIVYLNDGYVGGETMFNRTTPAPHVAVGGALLFRHDLLHEGLVVRSGTKYVLKTDLFVK